MKFSLILGLASFIFRIYFLHILTCNLLAQTDWWQLCYRLTDMDWYLHLH
jgi:hypothetical protein